MDNDLFRVYLMVQELGEQLAHNQKIVSTLQTQASTLKGQAIHNGSGYAKLRRLNVELSKEVFESELERSNAQIIIENQTLLHENKQLSMLLKEHEQTMDTVMSKFRNHALAAQQHELTLSRHYETLLLSREANSMNIELANNEYDRASLQQLFIKLQMLLRSLAGDDTESSRSAGDGLPEDSGGFLGDEEREDWAVERECEIARLERENEELRKLLGIDTENAQKLGWREEELEEHRPVLHILRASLAQTNLMEGWGQRSPPQMQPFSTGPIPGNAPSAPQQNIPLQRTIEFQPGMRAAGTLRRPSMFGRGGAPFWGPSPPQERQWLQNNGGLDLAG
ncbi:hypothetical protein M0805_003276 [Coniferiporia weirii]|nr:hypothetical protein M0805_003276 [Coniferiporia weirii]